MTTGPLTLDLDLDLHPDDAAALPRLRAFAPLRAGRARSSSVRLVWHDDVEGSLGQAGLALAQARGMWRLERLVPSGDAPWPPGQPPPPVSDTAQPPVLDTASTLIPWASFEGRSISYALGGAAEGATLTVLIGGLRTVTRERRLCRVLMSGPAEAVAPLALTLAEDIRLSVPRASLAGEALAAARERDTLPRRLGAPTLPLDATVGSAFAAIVGHLADVALFWAPAALAGDRGEEPVHQMRVALRRLRSAMGLFRHAAGSPLFDEAESGARALARVLGPARDWDVFLLGAGPAAEAAFPEEPAVRRLAAAAVRRRRASYAALAEHIASPAFRRLGLVLALLAADAVRPNGTDADDGAWSAPLDAFAARGLRKRWRAMVGDVDRLDDLPVEALHAIRLRGKRLRYACEFFAPAFPGKPARRFVRRLTVLQERLGALNDGAVAGGLMTELAGSAAERGFAAGIVLGMGAAGSKASRAAIVRAWERFRRLEPFWE